MNTAKILKFLPFAETAASLSKDRSTRVGAVALNQAHSVLAVGYNGMPRGCDDNVEARHQRPEKYFWFEHAERNLIYNAARHGVRLDGATLLVWGLFPCMDCARAIVQSGIVEVVAPTPTENANWNDHYKRARELFDEVGITVTLY